jgi:Holliday junction DNA helicase RuvA
VIASLTGAVRALGADWVVVDVAGVGYRVSVAPAVAASEDIGNSIDLLTSLIVREDAMTLFGFIGHEELQLFESLITVTGVGPRSAMAILSDLSPADVFTAVATEDESVFKKVSGIGPKTAKLIIVQLSGRLKSVIPDAPARAQVTTVSSRDEQVVAALVGLGWQSKVVSSVVADLNCDPQMTVAEVLRLSLVSLGKN